MGYSPWGDGELDTAERLSTRFYSLIYFGLFWVFIAVQAFSLVVVCKGYTLVAVCRFLIMMASLVAEHLL